LHHKHSLQDQKSEGRFYEHQLNKLSSFAEGEGEAITTLEELTDRIKAAGFPKSSAQAAENKQRVADIRADPKIKPEIFGKAVAKRISENKESKP
jgi:hypothetical protein